MGPPISFARIAMAVAEDAQLEVELLRDLRDRSPEGRAARARAVLIARRVRPELSNARLGAQLGGRKACTIVLMHGRAETRYEADPAERAAVARVLDALGIAELPPYGWTACAKGRLEPLDRLIASTEAKLAVYRERRARLLKAA